MGLKDAFRKKPLTWQVRPELLLLPQIPKPMHSVAPREILGGKWWDATRKTAYASTAHHCAACGVWKHEAKLRQWLEGHEVYQTDYVRGRLTYLETVPLCHCCHAFIHIGRLEWLLKVGKVPHATYNTILRHGRDVLRTANLTKPEPYNGPVAPWASWRLILNGVEYPPKYPTYEAWLQAMEEQNQ